MPWRKTKFLAVSLKILTLGYYDKFYGHSIAQNKSESAKGGVSLWLMPIYIPCFYIKIPSNRAINTRTGTVFLKTQSCFENFGSNKKLVLEAIQPRQLQGASLSTVLMYKDILNKGKGFL